MKENLFAPVIKEDIERGTICSCILLDLLKSFLQMMHLHKLRSQTLTDRNQSCGVYGLRDCMTETFLTAGLNFKFPLKLDFKFQTIFR